MTNKKRAFFVTRPRRATELRATHLPEDEEDVRIYKEVILDEIDYENFAEDMLVDREYLCDRGEGCILVRTRRGSSGILVEPTDEGFISRAALLALE